MRKFTEVTSPVIPLPLQNVDTDMIIPAQFLTSVSRAGYGENLFRRLRDGDPDFPLNQDRFKGAKILVAGPNFGCGSSREHAVWALQGAGIEVIIGSSFADIFSANCGKNGLVLVQLDEEVVRSWNDTAQAQGLTLTVSLTDQCVITSEGGRYEFSYNSFRRHCILNGLDDIDYILSHRPAIERFRAAQERTRFFTSLDPHHHGGNQ